MFHEEFLESCVFFLFTSFKSTGVKAEEQKQTREHACIFKIIFQIILRKRIRKYKTAFSFHSSLPR